MVNFPPYIVGYTETANNDGAETAPGERSSVWTRHTRFQDRMLQNSSVMFLPYLLPSSSNVTCSLPMWLMGMVLQALLRALMAIPGPVPCACHHTATLSPSQLSLIMASKHTNQGCHHTKFQSLARCTWHVCSWIVWYLKTSTLATSFHVYQ